MNYYIGLDIGTTSTKAVAFDKLGTILFRANEAYPTLYPKEKWATQNPETLFTAIKKSVKTVLEAIPQNHVLAGVGLSCAMHSILAIDQNGKLLTDLMIWSDNRADAVINNILATEGDVFYDSVGVPLHPMTPFAKLLWAKENKVAWHTNATLFLGIKEWIWHQLTGVYEMDFSVASATGMLDIHNNNWLESALKKAEITSSKLPVLVDTNKVRKTINNTLFPENIPIVIGATDGCLANIGAGAFTKNKLAVTIGTSAAARAIVAAPLFDKSKSTFCYYLSQNKYVIGGGSNSGGIVIEWFVKNFVNNDFDVFYDWIRHTVADDLLFLPYLQGERAPIWNAAAKGAFYGLNIQHTPKNMAKAVVEGIFLNIKQIIETLETIQNQRFNAVTVGGGATSPPIIMQLLSDVLGIEVHVTKNNEHSAWGATLMALFALGEIDNIETIDKTVATKIYIPNFEKNNFYHKKLQRFKTLYSNTKNL